MSSAINTHYDWLAYQRVGSLLPVCMLWTLLAAQLVFERAHNTRLDQAIKEACESCKNQGERHQSCDMTYIFVDHDSWRAGIRNSCWFLLKIIIVGWTAAFVNEQPVECEQWCNPTQPCSIRTLALHLPKLLSIRTSSHRQTHWNQRSDLYLYFRSAFARRLHPLCNQMSNTVSS